MRNLCSLILLGTNKEAMKRFLLQPAVWFALALTMIGISLILLARRITRVIKKTDDIADNDKTLVVIKCVGVVMMFVSILILVFV